MGKIKIHSILIIGNCSSEKMSKMIEWDEIGAISLIGLLCPTKSVTNQTKDIPLFSFSEDSKLNSFEIDIILLSEQNNLYIKEAHKRKRIHTLVIDIDTFWIIEKIAKQNIIIQNLSKDQKLFQTILMYSHEGIQFVDADGIIKFVNPSFSRITNIPPEERLGKNIAEVSPSGALNRALKTRAPVIGYISTGIGSNVETISNAAPIFVDEKFIGAVTTFQDITEIKYLSQQLKDREQEDENSNQNSNNSYIANYSFRDIIGESDEIRNTINIAKKAARTRSTVLITSESGTGKELFAHAIHLKSEFYEKPFVVVNCAAIPEALLESELFGYEKGAFTHAIKQKIGKIELANEGTLFLDEIGDMSLPLQAKLLRVLQSKEFERVGGLKVLRVNLRVIAATNCNLMDLVSEGKFREDLYYRLNVVRLEIPPLRKRKQDIPLLVKLLMTRTCQRINVNPMELTNKATSILFDYNWPGNIRELENFLERLINESPSSVIPDSLVKTHIQKLTSTYNRLDKDIVENIHDYPPTLPLRLVEREHIKRAIEHYDNSLEGKKRAALSLGISISTLYNKLRDYNIN